MYLWRIDRLKEALASGTLTERSRFIYLFVFLMISTLFTLTPFLPDKPNMWNRLASAAALVITAIGTWWAYRENGGRAGHHFLERYLSLGLVFLVRLIPFLLFPLMLIVGVIAGIWGYEETTGPVDFAVVVLMGTVYYAGVCRHMRHVVAMERAAQAGAPAV